MKERPILFRAPMVQAILAGRKTQTRRIVKEQPTLGGIGVADTSWVWEKRQIITPSIATLTRQMVERSPYGQPGDRLWCITIKPIKYGDGRFGVGDDGHVYRIDRGYPIKMAPRINHNGYEEIGLWYKGVQRPFRINRLICETFYRAPMLGEVCRHLDGNRRNNCPENLDWGTPKQNQIDASAAGSFSGENGSSSRLRASEVAQIRESSEPQAILAGRYNVTQPTISKIKRSKRWGAPPPKPPRNLPAWDSCITLEVTGVRVERLQDISEEDAKAEGVELMRPGFWKAYNCKEGFCTTAKNSFGTLWQEINGPESWDANPWVWVVNFKRVKP